MKINGEYWELDNDAVIVTPAGNVYTRDLEQPASLPVLETTGLTTEPLPSCVRWHIGRHPSHFFVLEFEPQVRNVKIKSTRYTLSFPYTVMFICRDQYRTVSCHVFFRVSPLSSLDDTLYYPPLWNIGMSSGYGHSKMCTEHLEDSHTHSIAIQNVVQLWFDGGFNDEVVSVKRVCEYFGLNKKLLSWRSWERETSRDPRFVWDIDWIEVRRRDAYVIGNSSDKDRGEIITLRSMINRRLRKTTPHQLAISSSL